MILNIRAHDKRVNDSSPPSPCSFCSSLFLFGDFLLVAVVLSPVEQPLSVVVVVVVVVASVCSL